MDVKNFSNEYTRIFDDYHDFKDETEKKLSNLLNLACKEFGDYLVKSKGFIHYKDSNIEYYYDPKTHIGIKYEVPNYIDLNAEYNSIPFTIVYKAQNKFLSHHKHVYYFYKKETPEKIFTRFKKFLGKAESNRMKEYLKFNYSKEMLAAERALKLKNINKQ